MANDDNDFNDDDDEEDEDDYFDDEKPEFKFKYKQTENMCNIIEMDFIFVWTI